MRSVISACIPSPLSSRIFTYSNKLSKPEYTQFVIHQSLGVARLKICCIKSPYKSISLSSEITAFPCSPPLFFTELSDDKVNARVISLVTALYLSILEGYTLVSPFDVPAETSSPKSVLKRHSINSSSKTSD